MPAPGVDPIPKAGRKVAVPPGQGTHFPTFNPAPKSRPGAAHRRREPYAWLGAGALALGMGCALASGSGIAHADEQASPGSSAEAAAPKATRSPGAASPARTALRTGSSSRGSSSTAAAANARRPASAAAVPRTGRASVAPAPSAARAADPASDVAFAVTDAPVPSSGAAADPASHVGPVTAELADVAVTGRSLEPNLTNLGPVSRATTTAGPESTAWTLPGLRDDTGAMNQGGMTATLSVGEAPPPEDEIQGALNRVVVDLQQLMNRPTCTTCLMQAVSAGFYNYFSAASNWLSTLPANPITDFADGALLLLRRNLFNQVPTAPTTQSANMTHAVATGTITAFDYESDPLTYKVVNAPTSGTVTVDSQGGFVYTSNTPGEPVSDNFSVAVSDQGFNLLAPFSSRSTAVQVLIGTGQLVSAMQGFNIVNLTNQVLWLTDSDWLSQEGHGPIDSGTRDDSCSKYGFCLTKWVPGKTDQRGQALLPGQVFYAAIATSPHIGSYWQQVRMAFTASDGATWNVGITPTYSDSGNGITGDFKFPDGTAFTSPAFTTPSSQTLFLLPSSGSTQNISADTTWDVRLPDVALPGSKGKQLCTWCQAVAEPDPVSLLKIMLDTVKQMPGLITAKYLDVHNKPLSDPMLPTQSDATKEAPLEIYNTNAQGNNAVTLNWTATATPQLQPASPWWQKYAAQGVAALGTKLLSGFVGESIATMLSTNAVGLVYTAPEVAAPKTITGKTTLTPLPHSYTVAIVSRPIYDVTGDVVFTAGSNTYSFKNLDFQIASKAAEYSTQLASEPLGYASDPGGSAGFALTPDGTGTTLLPDYKTGTQNVLHVSAFIGAGANTKGEDFSARGCVGSTTTGCTTFTVDNPSIAKIDIKPSGVAVLTALAPGQALVTATYNWAIAVGGVTSTGNPMPPKTGSPTALMSISVV